MTPNVGYSIFCFVKTTLHVILLSVLLASPLVKADLPDNPFSLPAFGTLVEELESYSEVAYMNEELGINSKTISTCFEKVSNELAKDNSTDKKSLDFKVQYNSFRTMIVTALENNKLEISDAYYITKYAIDRGSFRPNYSEADLRILSMYYKGSGKNVSEIPSSADPKAEVLVQKVNIRVLLAALRGGAQLSNKFGDTNQFAEENSVFFKETRDWAEAVEKGDLSPKGFAFLLQDPSAKSDGAQKAAREGSERDH